MLNIFNIYFRFIYLTYIFSFMKHYLLQNPCPEASSSFPSRLTYAWFDKLAFLGFRTPLKNSDLWDLNYTEVTNIVGQQFNHYWKKEQSKTKVKYVNFLFLNITWVSFPDRSTSVNLPKCKVRTYM